MKNAYRLFKRSNRPHYFIQNNQTGEQTSLGTSDWVEAKRLLDAKNQAHASTALNLQLGKTFIAHANPEMATRTWQAAMDEMVLRGGETSKQRYERAVKAKEFDLIRNKAIIETTSEDLKAVLKRGGKPQLHGDTSGQANEGLNLKRHGRGFNVSILRNF